MTFFARASTRMLKVVGRAVESRKKVAKSMVEIDE
jgi:hypothetical protein